MFDFLIICGILYYVFFSVDFVGFVFSIAQEIIQVLEEFKGVLDIFLSFRQELGFADSKSS